MLAVWLGAGQGVPGHSSAAQRRTTSELSYARGAGALVHTVAADADDLYRIAGQILAIPGVERTNTALVMRELVSYRITPLLQRRAQRPR